jgi:hypothetical protein
LANSVTFGSRHNDLRDKELMWDAVRRKPRNRVPEEAAMTEDRFSHIQAEQAPPPPTAAFMIVPTGNADSCGVSPLQWLYQQLYAQAQQTSQRPATPRDLFAVMN